MNRILVVLIGVTALVAGGALGGLTTDPAAPAAPARKCRP